MPVTWDNPLKTNLLIPEQLRSEPIKHIFLYNALGKTLMQFKFLLQSIPHHLVQRPGEKKQILIKQFYF